MSIRSLEASILGELRMLLKSSKPRQKDIMEWSTGEVKVRDGETRFHLPMNGVNVAVLTTALPKNWSQP